MTSPRPEMVRKEITIESKAGNRRRKMAMVSLDERWAIVPRKWIGGDYSNNISSTYYMWDSTRAVFVLDSR
jgi:hypothetical protein